MANKRRNPPAKWVLPDIVDPPRICFMVPVPNDRKHIAAFRGALLNLASARHWQDDIDHTALLVAAVWQEIYDEVNMTCCDECPETRTTEDGQQQYSPDGQTWYDYPGAMENPNFNNPQPYPSGTVPEGQTAECLAAENIVTVYKEFAQKTIDVLDAVAGWVALVAAIAAFIATVMSGGFVTAGAIAVAASILKLTDTWVNHALDNDVISTIRCALNCHADATGKFNPTSFDAVRSEITANAPVLAPIINQWLGGYGPVGLNRLAAAHIVSEADCSDCDSCGDCATPSAGDEHTTIVSSGANWNATIATGNGPNCVGTVNAEYELIVTIPSGCLRVLTIISHSGYTPTLCHFTGEYGTGVDGADGHHTSDVDPFSFLNGKSFTGYFYARSTTPFSVTFNIS